MLKDKKVLRFIYDRLIHVYKENQNYDYMLNLIDIIDRITDDGNNAMNRNNEYDKARNPKPTVSSLKIRVDRLENALTDLSIRQYKNPEGMSNEMGNRINNLHDRLVNLETIVKALEYPPNAAINLSDVMDSLDRQATLNLQRDGLQEQRHAEIKEELQRQGADLWSLVTLIKSTTPAIKDPNISSGLFPHSRHYGIGDHD